MQIIIYGEMGEGKTLLAAVLATALHKAGYEFEGVTEVGPGIISKESKDIMEQIKLAHLQDAHRILHPEVKKHVSITVVNKDFA